MRTFAVDFFVILIMTRKLEVLRKPCVADESCANKGQQHDSTMLQKDCKYTNRRLRDPCQISQLVSAGELAQCNCLNQACCGMVE